MGNEPAYSTSANGQQSNRSPDTIFDLLCVGFGPASLSIAIALYDAYQNSPSSQPRAHFLEKKALFTWHAGMQLPGTKMQISFLKDLATPRDPTSRFTFLNYVFKSGRLNEFINLNTFLPSRMEYEDYLRWCASYFESDGSVEYGMNVECVSVGERSMDGKVVSFVVSARGPDEQVVLRRARHVVIAVGGRPVVPWCLQGLKHVYHSSQFANAISKIHEKKVGRPLRFAIVGGGQSAAEIFNDIWTRLPDAHIRLIIKGASLRPSDDSPFVNEIFNPENVDRIYEQRLPERVAAMALDRGTNYGVVRLELLEQLYEKLYMQRLEILDETQWPARILSNCAVLSASQSPGSNVTLRLCFKGKRSDKAEDEVEDLEVDYVFTATGYERNAHEEMVSDLRTLLPEHMAAAEKLPVGRNYRVEYDEQKVGSQAGIWLQGCNEETHGLSDTLLSILAVRGGALVQSMFRKPQISAP